MAFGIDRFIKDLNGQLGASVRASLDGANQLFASPIEALFYASFKAAIELHPRYRHLNLGALAALDGADRDLSDDVFVGWQVRVLDWPVDFLVKARTPFLPADPIATLVIECDGHEFHERTKEQAARDRARDRALQAAGITIMRFTGAELYRDPMKCACEALEWCLTNTERS